MKLKSLFTAAAVLSSATIAQATTIYFDDLNTGSGAVVITSPYEGFTWDNFYVLNAGVEGYSGSGYEYGTISPDNVAFNAFGNPASISSTDAFDLTSAYVTAAWNNLTLTVQGYNGSTLAYTLNVALNTTTPTFVEFDFTNVTSVTFSTSDNSQVAVDNLTINGSAVPEPSSSMLIGLAGLGLLSRRRK